MSFLGGLDSQLDSLQYALNGAIAAAHQTHEMGKREILIPMGDVVKNTKMTKIGEGKWVPVTVTESVEVTENAVETKVLASGICVYQEVQKVTRKSKLRTTSEFIRIPKEGDIYELSAPKGTPISPALLAALKANNPSAALNLASEAYWGESTAPGSVTVGHIFGSELNICL
jgi:hypothetical protein